MTIDELQQEQDQYVMHTYAPQPVCFVDGYDSTLIDTEGKEYLDFVAGIAVSGLGYSNQAVKQAIQTASEHIIHTSNLYHIQPQIQLAKKLVEHSFGDKAFFSNSGAEANEGAMKLARRYAYFKYGNQKNKIIAIKGSFHGRTLATLNVTDTPKYKEGYGPDPIGFGFVPFNDIQAIEEAMDKDTAAVILELVQGEGGVNVCDEAYIKRIRELTKEYDAALIIDEVQTGMGRTGTLFAYEQYGIEPDIMTLAKGLGNGVPIGAIVATDQFAQAFKPGAHGTTYGGNHLVTTVANTVFDEILEQDIPQAAKEQGEYLRSKLEELKETIPSIKAVRGKGLLVGMELDHPGGQYVLDLLKEGILINCTKDKVIRLIPSLIITKEEIDRLVSVLKAHLSK